MCPLRSLSGVPLVLLGAHLRRQIQLERVIEYLLRRQFAPVHVQFACQQAGGAAVTLLGFVFTFVHFKIPLLHNITIPQFCVYCIKQYSRRVLDNASASMLAQCS